MSALDSARAVRSGEELDTEKLRTIFAQKLPKLTGELTVQQFPKGHSNLTYLLTVGDQEFVLRRPPKGAKQIKAGHDMNREYTVLTRLRRVYPKVPKALFYVDENESPFDVGFYVMERVPGVILRNKPPEGYDLNPALMQKLSETFVDNLVALHAINPASARLDDFGKPEGYVTRQVEGWIERYNKAKTDDVPDMDTLAAWMRAHLPPQQAGTIIHNDYKYDNLVLDPADLTNIRAVLDWEMATLGDPLADLGTALAYWFEPSEAEVVGSLGLGLTTLPGNLSREEIVQRYAAKSGRDVSNILFYYVAALHKVAVIAQQIYFRYKQGLTQDERFAGMLFAVQMLSQAGVRATELGRIGKLLG
ncbi:MAG: phosphotransferase family protein [Deltaproteobacteria bacterium]|nr:phosphotransferase family protein [Deltaproteobacteria bacterium]